MPLTGQLKLLVSPTYLSATLTTNIYNNASALIYDNVKHIRVSNTSGSPASFSIYKGATGANTGGTELWKAVVVAANSDWERFMNMKLLSTDFLVGGCVTGASLLTIIIEGEQVVV